MIFEKYDPKDDAIFRIIDNEGIVTDKGLMPDISRNDIAEAYRKMLFARTADEMAVSYQRQGRMYTYAPNIGQEAISVAAGMVMRKDDWLVPAFRELGAWLAKGVSLKEVFLYFMGNEEGSNFKDAAHVLPVSVPIATHFLHAAGIGFSINYQKRDEVVFTFTGDGGTSEGDFAEALNFAAVWNAPVVFTVQNNQYAISVPVRSQTKSVNLAIKAYAYGIPGIKVDGNDLFAMYSVYREALEYSKSGRGPVLIEAFTYRKGAHTTSDDPGKYRTKTEEEEHEKTDPLARLKKYMISEGIWKDDEEKLVEGFRKEIDKQFDMAEKAAAYNLNDVFRYTFVEMPDDLKRQQMEYEKFLKWKENRK